MRLRTVLTILVWAAILGYVVYVAAFATSNYFQMAEVVEEAFEALKTSEIRRELMRAGSPAPVRDRAQIVYDDILKRVTRRRLILDERKLIVVQTERDIQVFVKWSYPVITFGGENVLAIPLTLERLFGLKA